MAFLPLVGHRIRPYLSLLQPRCESGVIVQMVELGKTVTDSFQNPWILSLFRSKGTHDVPSAEVLRQRISIADIASESWYGFFELAGSLPVFPLASAFSSLRLFRFCPASSLFLLSPTESVPSASH